MGKLLLARSWVLEEIEYQVSLSLLEENVHNGSFLDSWTLVRIVAFVEPMTSRYYSTFSLQSVEVILYDTHGEVEFSFDLSKVGAWICLDELQYADSFGVLDLHNLGRLRLSTLQAYSYWLGEKCLGGLLKGSSRTFSRKVEYSHSLLCEEEEKKGRERGRGMLLHSAGRLE